MSDDQKDLPPKPPVPVARGFSCGGGPCRTFYVFENEATVAPPPLPPAAVVVRDEDMGPSLPPKA